MLKTPPTSLEQATDKHISHFCTGTLGSQDDRNHCAHFVSHIMEYDLPGSATCKNFSFEDKKNVKVGAMIRVNEVFNKLEKVAELANKPAQVLSCLVFVTLSGNVTKKGAKLEMGEHRKKHIGILYKGKVWNYSNSKDKVVADTLDIFKAKYTHSYMTSGNTVNFYYGEFL